MDLIKLKCKSCGATLELDTDKLIAYCPYCGSKLLLDMDEIGSVLKEKENTKQVQLKEEHMTKRDQLKYEYKEREDKRNNKFILIWICIMMGIGLFCLLLSLILS